MNYNKGRKLFHDIPGYDASKGERIVKALQRLCAKIEHLEQIRNSERKFRSKEVQTSSNSEDLTFADVQHKLLILQLQYTRSLIRKKSTENIANEHEEPVNIGTIYKDNRHNQENAIVNDLNHLKIPVVNEETQTGNSLIDGIDLQLNTELKKHKEKKDAEITIDRQASKFDDYPEYETSMSRNTLSTKSKPHYHLKLNDVPFILGASSSASHSVVANVQNIIAMMKSHNKALCGPKHNIHVPSAVNTHATISDSQDTSKMLNDLSQDLYELALKQAQLVKRMDAAQGKDHTSKAFKHSVNDGRSKQTKAIDGDLTCSRISKRLRSTSESKVDISNNLRQRHIQLSTTNQTNNIPIVARRKFLQSLKDFKTHLSEEDISWK